MKLPERPEAIRRLGEFLRDRALIPLRDRALIPLRDRASKVLSSNRVYWGVAVVALLALIIWGYRFPWTGFAEAVTPKSERVDRRPAKTLWDWLGLLIVPGLLAWVALRFNHAREKEARRRERDRLREEALQGYLDRMTGLMLDKGLRPSKPNAVPSESDDMVRYIARARTLTVLRRLDGKRKGSLLIFLHESDLIAKSRTVIDLSGADLSGAHLRGADLRVGNLSGADLRGAHLEGADLRGADLSGADLRGAHLSGAHLGWADLSETDLFEADLRGAELGRAELGGAKLGGAVLSETDLEGVIGLTQDQLDSAKSDESTKLPRWLTRPKSRGGGPAAT